MDVYLTHLGCRLNESEIEELAWRIVRNGHRVVHEPGQADVCVVNTCTVTGEAGRKSRQAVRRLARLNPDAQIAVTGCHATMAPDEVAQLPNVVWVVGNEDKARLAALVAPAGETRRDLDVGPTGEPILPGEDPRLKDAMACPPGAGALGRTRAFVKVQDGCDNRCTFCVTTVARGRGQSRRSDQILAEVQRLVAQGYQEAVLTGVHLGSYGQDRGEADGLYRLVRSVLDKTEVPRLRLSSLEPWDLAAGFFDLWDDPRMCRQLHLPLQSGCDATLRRMGRRTHTGDFAELVAAARARIPDLALTTDIIVGFPGESAEEFDASRRFVEAMDFARLHVFPYSPRPGTAAARMPGQVPMAVKTARSRAMRQLGRKQVRAFHKRFIGRTLPVLWESSKGGDVWRGLSDNYLTVTTRCTTNLANRIEPTQLVAFAGHALEGVVAPAGAI